MHALYYIVVSVLSGSMVLRHFSSVWHKWHDFWGKSYWT